MTKGEQFPEPVSDKKIEQDCNELKQYCLTGLENLEDFKTRHDQAGTKPAHRAHRYAMNALESFTEIIHAINDMKHPADVERLLKGDEVFAKHFSNLVKGIRASKVLEFEEKYISEAERETFSGWGKTAPELLSLAKRGLVQADIYLASRLDKNPTQNEQK